MVSVGRHGRVKSLFNNYGAKVREYEIEEGVVGIYYVVMLKESMNGKSFRNGCIFRDCLR